MSIFRTSRSRGLGIAASVVTAIGLVFGGLVIAGPANADTMPPDPTNPATPPTVGADALPTTQIDGVAWAQTVVGNTVYVAGKFSTARPAGSPAGSNTTPRSNLLAYNITTGALITSFNVPLNAQALAVAATPDGSRVYVGGDFTTAGGGNYYRIVAISTATGQIVSSFRPIMESQVRALAATNTAVYAGGTFSSVNGTSRGYIAKIDASNGSLMTGWTASADYVVDALAVSPDGSKVYAGGRFKNVNGSAHYGLAMLTGTTGTALPFPANSVVRDAGTQAGITTLVATADRIYGAGYVFGSGGNLEGSFAADANSGALIWLEDCHGDTYSVYPLGDALYAVGHPHDCRNVGGYPETNPRTFHHSIAFSKARTGTLTNDGNRSYFNFSGQPSPTLLNWFPDYVTGSYTGQGQAAWSLAGNSQYLAVGGEFPFVNGVAQYGLTRYAFDSVVRSKVGPNNNTAATPNATSPAAGQARITWTSTYDQDNTNLNYKLVRDGNTASPVYQTNQLSTFWNRPAMGFTDSGLAGGSQHTYRLYVTDPDGNQINRTGNTVTIAGGGANQNPVASFVVTPNGLSVSVDGSASSDPDGSIASYAWTFGDGGTATGATAGHTYAAAGTYTVALTVTDNRGGQASTSKSVTVTAATGSTVARDAFERSVASGWGTADVGGAWTGAGVTSAYTVASGTGQMIVPAGNTKTETLNAVSSNRTDTTVTFTTDVASSGGGIFVSAIGRQVGSVGYEGRAWISSSGAVQVQLLQSGNTLQAVPVSGLTYSAGQQLSLRVQVFGTSPTTVRAKLWPAIQAEPAAWQASVTDATAALQANGAVGLRVYVSAAATLTPVTTRFDNYAVAVVP
ncbi:PKD domain-containing protein [Leifsonia sp. PS1209]|uniref:PKD domain-containing protein n=1 Tax=Leifsonia sp. PS1209 TaxID=2724914 RepID=UPI001442B1CB|nr:PKD domain-containing protein [Leifsonia sp. PS1209]QIZ97877.1 PKD domain-containing protein [Leifsonia sp. PS1209]